MTDSSPALPQSPIEFVDGRFLDPNPGRVLIGILTCDKYKGRADGIRNSWLKLVPANYRVLFIHGRPGQPAGVEGDCLYVDCPESYELLPRKVHAFLVYAHRHFDFDYLFKTDDDTYLDLERFIAFARHGADYIGQFRELPVPEIGKTWHYGKCTDKAYEVPYERPFVCAWATGGGYFLSRAATLAAASRTESTCADSLFEDVMVGEALTLDPQLKVLMTRFSAMGVVNPLLPKDMLYLQDVVLERKRLADEVRLLRAENARLRSGLAATDGVG